MGIFVIVNSETGEVESGCPQCGIVDMGDSSDASIIPLDQGHTAIEVTMEEKGEFAEAKVLGEGGHFEYGMKLDMRKAAGKLEEREKVEVPIEAEGIGGKEIIAVEEKPVGIIVERSSSPKRVT